MKLLAVADLQLDAHPSYSDDRLAEQEAVWRTALDLGLEHGCDAVLFAGDATEHRTPSSQARAAFQRPLVGYPLPVVAVVGNHDVRHADIPTAIELAGAELGGGLVIASKRPELIQPTDLPMLVATLPYVTTGWIRARQEQVDTDEANLTAAQLLLSIARGLRAKAAKREPSWPCVLLGHFPTTGFATPTGFQTESMGTVVLPLEEVQALGFDAAVFGDIHLPGVIADDPLVLSPGSPLPLDFGESSCEHGCWLLEAEQGCAEATFLPIESRRFLTIDADLVDRDLPVEPHDALVEVIDAERIAAGGLDGAILKFRYRATAEQARRISVPALEQALLAAGAHRVFVEPHVERPARARVEGMTATLAPLDALDLWIANQDPPLTGAQAHGLREWTRRALTEAGT